MAKKSSEAVEKAMGIDEYKPCLELNEKMYPGVKDLTIDEVITLELKVKVKSISRNTWNGNKLSVSAEILDAESDTDEDD